ncbi:MAG: hypothetical protein M0Z82_16790 [Actinomycetota bacterium]|nr:hypothetical protein [Actinomycetota bacterium]
MTTLSRTSGSSAVPAAAPAPAAVAEGSGAGGASGLAGARSALRLAVKRRVVPLVALAVSVAGAMVWSLVWQVHTPGCQPGASHGAGAMVCSFAHHLHPYGVSSWRTPGDIWGTLRSAQTIVWGDFGGIYAAGTSLVSFPGAALLLAPVALVADALHLTASFPYPVPHPTAWLVLGPYEVAAASFALFGADRLAERLGVGRAKRAVLVGAGAAVLFPVDAIWGHPEDAVAMGLLLYALVFALDRRVVGAGWLAGAAVAVQPLVLLGLPVLAAVLGARRLVGFMVRSAVPSVAVLVVPLIAAPRDTLHALLDQPNFPLIDHVTPWTALAPSLGGHGTVLAVAAGPGRVVAVVLAAALAPWVAKRRRDPTLVVWALAAALALRCLTESVMDPFYLWPPLAVAVVAAGTTSRARLGVVALAAMATSAGAELHGAWWLWWYGVTAGMVLAVAVAYPTRRGDLAGGGARRSEERLICKGSAGSAQVRSGVRTQPRASSSGPGMPLAPEGREFSDLEPVAR